MIISGLLMWAAWLPVAALVLWLEVRRRAGVWRTLGVLFFPMPIDVPPMPGGGGIGWAKVNLMPLREVMRALHHQNWHQIDRVLGGNFLLLVPFTLLGPVLWPRLRAWRWALAMGMGLSASIELLQLALCALLQNAYRSVDVDDVIVNTAGALLGYALFVGGRRWLRCSRPSAPPAEGGSLRR
jgi:glycopeptide antibiotics resistance protein